MNIPENVFFFIKVWRGLESFAACVLFQISGKHSVPFFRQLWLVLGVKLMEINSNLFSRH